MSSHTPPCEHPVPFETLVAYWAADLPAGDTEALEEHLMRCSACSAASMRVGAVTEAVRRLIPPIVTAHVVGQLRDQGLRIAENRFSPGERREAYFPADIDVLLHRLAGLDLSRAVRVGFVLRVEGTGQVLLALDDVPFDPEAGSVLVACQQHYAFMPPDNVAEVRTRDAAGQETTTTYTILHRYAPRPG